MAYDLHITRAEFWLNSADQPIALEEWISYVQQDVELELEDPISENVWVGYSGQEENDKKAWFYYSKGSVGVKHPNEQTIAKMMEIAKKLNAHVQGDEGEFYGAQLQKKSFWKKIIG